MLNGNNGQKNFPLGRLTRFGVGGTAQYFVRATTAARLQALIRELRADRQRFIIIGTGTNLVVPDRGLTGYVIQNKIHGIQPLSQCDLLVGAGVNLNYLVNYCNRHGLAGLEKLADIPGTLGGAIVGDAGAYGQEIGERVERVQVFDGKRTFWLRHRSCRFAYRDSVFKQRRDWVILAAKLGFTRRQAPQRLASVASDIRRRRQIKYPPGLRCPGSYFKNLRLATLPAALEKRLRQIFPEKIQHATLPAAVLIEAVGLKGKRVGQIKVADYHGNLIMNLGGGRARDVLALVASAKKMVYGKFRVKLEEEVRVLDN